MGFSINKITIFLIVAGLANTAYADCVAAGDTLRSDNTLYFCSGYDYESFKTVVITTTGNGSFSPLGGFGIYNSNSKFQNVEITTSGRTADAIQLNSYYENSIEIKNNLTIVTNGTSADGVNITENTSNSKVIVRGDVNITNNNQNFWIVTLPSGIGLRANNARNENTTNEIIIDGKLSIKTAGYGENSSDATGYGIYAGIRDSAVDATKGKAKVTINGMSNIQTSGSEAHAVYANRTGTVILHDTEIKTTGQDAAALYADSKGEIYLNGAVKATSSTNSGKTLGTVIAAKDAGSIVTTENAGTLKYYQMDLNGHLLANNGGLINLGLDKKSVLVGNLSATGASAKIQLSALEGSSLKGDLTATGSNSIVDLSLAGGVLDGDSAVDFSSTNKVNISLKDALWQMNNDSFVTSLNVTNSNINLGNPDITAHTPRKLYVDTLSGTGGIFNMVTDIASANDPSNPITDQLFVTNASSGNHYFLVHDHNTGGYTLTGNEALVIAQINDKVAQFELKNTNGYVDLGAYKYELDSYQDADGEHWFLRHKEQKSDPANHSASTLNLNYLVAYAENNMLRQRLGELRAQDNRQADAWVRSYKGKMDSLSGSGLRSFDVNYYGLQIGADFYQQLANADAYFGTMVGYTDAKADHDLGDNQVKDYHVGAYATFVFEGDWYLDTIAKYSRMRNSINAQTGGGTAVKGRVNTYGYALSAELGKRFYLHSSPWYLEPQAQLTYSRQGDAKLKSSNGLETKLDSFDSVIGRTSVEIGYQIPDQAFPVEVYWRTGYLKEFKASAGYQFNSDASSYERLNMKGHWWEQNIGVNAQLKEQHNLYLDMTYASGNRFKHKAVNLGYRYSF